MSEIYVNCVFLLYKFGPVVVIKICVELKRWKLKKETDRLHILRLDVSTNTRSSFEVVLFSKPVPSLELKSEDTKARGN